jgi:hypothetical protein
MFLHFTPSTKEQATKFRAILDDSPFSYEFNYDYFSFEEDEETVDQLEMDLTKILDSNEIDGYFELDYEDE